MARHAGAVPRSTERNYTHAVKDMSRNTALSIAIGAMIALSSSANAQTLDDVQMPEDAAGPPMKLIPARAPTMHASMSQAGGLSRDTLSPQLLIPPTVTPAIAAATPESSSAPAFPSTQTAAAASLE
jgi:hypothetical protein